MVIDFDLIKKRAQELEEARQHLKNELIGIDDIIDKFINSIKVWYIMPEIQTRPLIINLWGITGVGKTDLVRKFIKMVNMNDRFTEIQMDSKEGNATIEDYLENTLETTDTQGVLLLDEIQRFRTVKEDGSENSSNKFQDLWMLLSDGIFQSNSKIKQELIRMILEDSYWSERSDDDDDDDDENTTEDPKAKKIKLRMFKTSYWEANRIKKLLKLDLSVDEIMKWDKAKKLKVVKESLTNTETFSGKKYSKLLIIVSGNLDEAFTMARDVDDSDGDADVYHKYSKSINIINIKASLGKRFKPEQIARLGNIHIIYPIPNKESYKGIIRKQVTTILKNVRDNNNITIEVDQSVYDVIYSNGVFPTQGVRPVLSTVSSILENSIPEFLYEYLKEKQTGTIHLTYSDGFLRSNIGGKEVSYAIPTVLDDIKKKQTLNQRTLVAVHEAGHAVAYAALFKLVPTQIVASTANENAGGFIGKHMLTGTRRHLMDDITVMMAGRAAEMLVFGHDLTTNGASSDIMKSTSVVGKYIRKWGLDENLGYYTPEHDNRGDHKSNIASLDFKIEAMIIDRLNAAEALIKTYPDFLIEVSESLIENPVMSHGVFQEIANKYIGKIQIVDASEVIDGKFHDSFERYKKTIGK